MYYWEIKWKSYEAESLYVTDKQKEYIENEWVKKSEDRTSQVFKLNGETFRFDSIDNITKTTKKVDNLQKLLYAAEASLQSKQPLYTEDGEVVTNWYKKLVSLKEFENYYAKHHDYYTLDKADGGVWIGMRLVEMENGDRSSDLEQCSKEEADRLWKYSKSS